MKKITIEIDEEMGSCIYDGLSFWLKELDRKRRHEYEKGDKMMIKLYGDRRKYVQSLMNFLEEAGVQ